MYPPEVGRAGSQDDLVAGEPPTLHLNGDVREACIHTELLHVADEVA